MLKIIAASRISPVKKYETLIKAVSLLTDLDIEVKIIGQPLTPADKLYFQKLQTLIKKLNLSHKIHFIGPLTQKELVKHLCQADLFVHCQAGSLDKAPLEAMSCGVPTLTPNPDYGAPTYKPEDPQDLADKIRRRNFPSPSQLRNIVVQNHNLKKLAKKIIEEFS